MSWMLVLLVIENVLLQISVQRSVLGEKAKYFPHLFMGIIIVISFNTFK